MLVVTSAAAMAAGKKGSGKGTGKKGPPKPSKEALRAAAAAAEDLQRRIAGAHASMAGCLPLIMQHAARHSVTCFQARTDRAPRRAHSGAVLWL